MHLAHPASRAVFRPRFSRSLARGVGGYDITVNVITPGLTVTQAVRDSFPPEILEAQRAGRAISRDEEPEDLVGPVFFLASPDADFISGQTLTCSLVAENVTGETIPDCGHFLPEERPQQLVHHIPALIDTQEQQP